MLQYFDTNIYHIFKQCELMYANFIGVKLLVNLEK
jgi:hypothetical protein